MQNLAVTQFLVTEFKLCLVSNRLDFFKIDDYQFLENTNMKYEYDVLDFTYNPSKNEFAVVCKSQIVFIDVDSGRQKRIFVNLFENKNNSQYHSCKLLPNKTA